MSYRPKIGDTFTIKGKNVLGEMIHSKAVYKCVQRDSQQTIAINEDGTTFHFQNRMVHQYIQESEVMPMIV